MSEAVQPRICNIVYCKEVTIGPTRAYCTEHHNSFKADPKAFQELPRKVYLGRAARTDGQSFFGSHNSKEALRMLRERLADDRANGITLGGEL